MPVDYSKWDALELSDDSDVEVHPNVDKRSFIRAKQNQIHQERQHRKHEIDTLKYERVVNSGLIKRIDGLLSALKSHAEYASKENAAKSLNADETVFQCMLESSGDPKEDNPPPRPEGVHTKLEEQPTYSKMMAALVDQVKKTVDEEVKPKPEERLGAFVKEVGKHKEKVGDLQRQLLKRLAELEKLEGTKITSESIHTGFSSSHVAKATKETTLQPQLLNTPHSTHPNAPASSGSEADDPDEDPPQPPVPSPLPTREIQPTALGRRFADLPPHSYQSYLQFISQNPSVLAERETDGLLMQAFDLEYAGKPKEARQAVHQALLLQYCRSLGADGVALFFRRIAAEGHQARKMFFDDVADTYKRLRQRSREMAREGNVGNGPEEDGGVADAAAHGLEQIQLHAVNPGQKILIVVPKGPPEKEGEEDGRSEEEKENWDVFAAFPPGLQRALRSGELEEVNKVLGKMSVDEGEATVGKLSEGGMLSLEEGIVDATTEEGRRELEEIENAGRDGGIVEEVQEESEEDEHEEKKAVDEVD